MSENNQSEPINQMKTKIAKEVLNGLVINESNIETYLIVVAVNKELSKNFLNKIPCKKGVPIGGYVYDAQSDCYFVECADFLYLGVVPISFVAKSKSSIQWQINVPLPENVIKRFLTQTQKKDLKTFKSHFKMEDYDISYIQMVNPN